jgi:DnaJ-domain-containing protein 1
MTLVETVLEMLCAYFPGFEIDEEWARPKHREPQQQREPAEARAAPRTPEPENDPVLARCYAELGVPYAADFSQVRRAWRRLMREHHPDVQGKDPERQRASTELAQRLNDAFGEIRRRLPEGRVRIP